jgi:hypothetical protein
MTLEDVYFIASIFAAIGVIISLVFVGLQVRQSTAATRAAAAQTVHGNFSNWYTSLQNQPEVLGLTIKGFRDYQRLTEIEKAQFITVFMSFSLYHQDAFFKWKDGSLSPELWRGWESVSMNLFTNSGGKEFWEERGYMFSQSFQNYIDTDLMKRDMHPKSKPFGASRTLGVKGENNDA